MPTSTVFDASSIPCAFSSEEIAAQVNALAEEISRDYADKDLVMIGVLKGAWMFLADLFRALSIPAQCEFVRVGSYGSGTVSSGAPELIWNVQGSLKDRDVLIVDDIIDTGLTTAYLLDHFAAHEPSTLRVCALLDKPSRRKVEVPLAYRGFEIPDMFVIGYGIDYAEQYRWLPYIGYIPSTDNAE